MLALNTSDTLKGLASAANAVTCTVLGDSISGGGDAFSVLAQLQLTTSAGTILDVAATQRLVKTIVLANVTGSPVTVTLYINGTAAANQIVSFVIPANGSATYNSAGWTIYDSTGRSNQPINTDYVPQGTTNLYATATSAAAIIHAATAKTPPVDADELPLADSAASFGLKKLTWASLKAAAAAYVATVLNAFTNLQAVTPYRANISGAVSIDLTATGKSNNLHLTLTGNVTSFALTNPVDGMVLNIRFYQDATGSRTFAGFPSAFKFGGGTAPTFSTAANALDLLSCEYGATENTYVSSFVKGLA